MQHFIPSPSRSDPLEVTSRKGQGTKRASGFHLNLFLAQLDLPILSLPCWSLHGIPERGLQPARAIENTFPPRGGMEQMEQP